MAKHMVKCLYCSQQFDTNAEEYIQVNKKRYAHKKCAEDYEANKTQEQKDKEALEEYILQLFQVEFIHPRVAKQIKEYIEKYNYTYTGIHKALKYFYEIKNNDISKANQGIGIVPYVYKQSFDYYYALWLAQEKNKDKEIQGYKPEVIEIKIKEPQLKPKKRKLFSFLDEEEEE